MQDLEEDPEMRAGLLLYKGTRASNCACLLSRCDVRKRRV
jgi:hypothetical protein